MGRKYASERKLPHRDEQAHAQRETPPHRARKNTKRWCRGKPGVEHQPHTVVAEAGWLRGHDGGCRRLPWWPERWHCLHQDVCGVCGKILRQGFGSGCPDYQPLP